MTFEYSDAPQRSPAWFKIRMGKVSASRLEDWLAVSKAKDAAGKPLKARLDYEKELRFERQFNTSFEKFMTEAMQDGVDYEDFARKQYELLTKTHAVEVGCWYNEYFVASPDRTIGDDGLIEVKILRDTSFTDVLISGVPSRHWNQIQGQLWATGRLWCDYVSVNLNTKKMVVIRVEADTEFHKKIEASVQEPLITEEFNTTNLHDLLGDVPIEGNEVGIKGVNVW